MDTDAIASLIVIALLIGAPIYMFRRAASHGKGVGGRLISSILGFIGAFIISIIIIATIDNDSAKPESVAAAEPLPEAPIKTAEAAPQNEKVVDIGAKKSKIKISLVGQWSCSSKIYLDTPAYTTKQYAFFEDNTYIAVTEDGSQEFGRITATKGVVTEGQPVTFTVDKSIIPNWGETEVNWELLAVFGTAPKKGAFGMALTPVRTGVSKPAKSASICTRAS